MNKNLKNVLCWAFVAVFVVVFIVMFLSDDTKHIADTNGADNYELTTITDENIIKQNMGALNVHKSTSVLNDGITFSSNKFTGVYEILVTNFWGKSDFLMDVAGFTVTEGNFKMAVINNGEIIAVVEPGMFAECCLEDLTGTLSLRIAGESAAFSFSLDRLFCEQYNITVD